MKKILSFGFLLMGFSFTVTQGLLIRELLVAFFGNELSIGLILGNWLILEAAGSGLLGRLADRWKGKVSSYAALQILFALFLPLCLYAVYTSRRLAGAIPGEGVGLTAVFYSSFLILTPLALIDGAMFAFGCRACATLKGEALAGDEISSIARVYVYEALGAIVGGIVFTYLFIPLLYSLQIVLLLSGLNLLSAVLILTLSNLSNNKKISLRSQPPSRVRRPGDGAQSVYTFPCNKKQVLLTPGLIVVLVLLTASLGLLLSPQTENIQHWATSRQWAGFDLRHSENSVYGNVAVVQQETQYTFYADGIPILTAPVPDVALTEEIVHLPLLFISQPRRALVLSGGV
jgi:spermidine synthase